MIHGIYYWTNFVVVSSSSFSSSSSLCFQYRLHRNHHRRQGAGGQASLCPGVMYCKLFHGRGRPVFFVIFTIAIIIIGAVIISVIVICTLMRVVETRSVHLLAIPLGWRVRHFRPGTKTARWQWGSDIDDSDV